MILFLYNGQVEFFLALQSLRTLRHGFNFHHKEKPYVCEIPLIFHCLWECIRTIIF